MMNPDELETMILILLATARNKRGLFNHHNTIIRDVSYESFVFVMNEAVKFIETHKNGREENNEQIVSDNVRAESEGAR